MSIDSIFPITLGADIPSAASVEQKGQSDFTNWLKTEMHQLNEQITSSENKLEHLATGEYNNLHDVMMSLEKAKLSFELVVQVRNKLLEGYQKIMRMQI